MRNKIYNENCLTGLKKMPDNSIDCCVTSPPYWGLRDYGTAKWIDGDKDCDHYIDRNVSEKVFSDTKQGTKDRGMWRKKQCPKCGATRVDDQLGLEETPDKYVKDITEIFTEVKRVLKPEGTLWLNLGDTYSGSGKGAWDKTDVQKEVYIPCPNGKAASIPKVPVGLKAKDLVGIPWMVAFALRSSGWYLRQDIIWHKPNPMPESVTDRCTKSHEYIFLMSKSAKYYYDNEAIKVPFKESSIDRVSQDLEKQAGSDRVPFKSNGPMKASRPNGISRDRLLNYKSKEKILRPNVKRGGFNKEAELENPLAMANKKSVWTVNTKGYKEAHFATFPEKLIVDCIKAGCPENGIVLDCFMGAGTTALVARKLNRNYIGFELNKEYIDIAEKRLYNELGIFK